MHLNPRRWALAVMCLVLACIGGGCGSSESAERSDKYVQQTIKLHEQINRANATLTGIDPSKPSQAKRGLVSARDAIASVTKQRSRLDPPARMQGKHDALIELADSVNTAFNRAIAAAQAGDSKGIIRERNAIMELGKEYFVLYQQIVSSDSDSQKAGPT